MKKFILMCLMLAVGSSALFAGESNAGQNESFGTYSSTYDGVWKRTKSWGIGYVSSTLHRNDYNTGSQFGFATDLVKTYVLTKQPIGGFMKVGIDAKWFDINYVKYKNEVSNAHFDWDADDDYDYGYDDDDDEDFDIGSHNLNIGIGVGPSLQFAPFINFNNGLRDLRADIFCHFTPSFSLLTLKEDGETKFYYGFNPTVNFGVNLQWKMIGVGFEGRWGFPKYSSLNEMFEDFDEDLGDFNIPTATKTSNKITSSSFRFFIRLCF